MLLHPQHGCFSQSCVPLLLGHSLAEELTSRTQDIVVSRGYKGGGRSGDFLEDVAFNTAGIGMEWVRAESVC